MFRKLLVVLGCCISFVLVFLLWPSASINISAAAAPQSASAPPNQLLAADSPLSPTVPSIVTSSDDRENATPTAWWVYSGQTVSDIVNTINNDNARIVDIYLEAVATPRKFTVTYVHNTGAYAKSWWWYVDVDESTLSTALSTNNARLISLKALCLRSSPGRWWMTSVDVTTS